MWILLAALAAASPTVVTAGSSHSCFARHDGTVWCWGGLSVRDLEGGAPAERLTPAQVPGLDGVRHLDAGGGRRTCAIREDRSVWCWDMGEAPAAVPGLEAEAVSVGEAHACAVDRGRVWCWGYNRKGQLGDGTTVDRDHPVRAGAITDAVEVVAGWYHSCALHGTGAVSCWGSGASGQLGYGPEEDRSSPAPVRYLADAVDLDAGSAHTCAVRTGGQVVCWGAGLVGQLGSGRRENSPVLAAVPGEDDAVRVVTGLDHVCALRREGTVACWGNNEAGQLGNEEPKGHQLVPLAVEGLGGAVGISAGSQHTCVLRTGGSLSCFGQNLSGQLGDGTTEKQMRPVVVIP